MSRAVSVPTNDAGATAMTAARRALEERGYLWQEQPDGSALAHEKGRPITGRALAWRVLIKVTPRDGELELERATSGASGFLLGPTVGVTSMVWTDSEYKRAVKDVRAAVNRS